MTSQRPYTYNALCDIAAEQPKYRTVPYPVRQNTEAQWDEEDSAWHVLYYGTRIATLYANGSVRIDTHGRPTVSTMNRINDTIIPLGWRAVVSNRTAKEHAWVLKTVQKPIRRMEFVDEMILTNINHKDMA